MRRSLLSLALLGLGVLASCGGGPLTLEAARDLLPKAREQGQALQEQLLAIDTAEAATAARPRLAPLVDGFAEMVGRLGPVKGLFKGSLGTTWSEVTEAIAAIRGRTAAWAADAQGKGGKILEALGPDLVERIRHLGD
jgi:hypothetical protein